MSEFEIGDVVKVINAGCQFSTHFKWAEKHELHLFQKGKSAYSGDEGVVVAKGQHLDPGNTYGTIYGIRVQDRHYIFSTGGLALIAPAPSISESVSPTHYKCGDTYIQKATRKTKGRTMLKVGTEESPRVSNVYASDLLALADACIKLHEEMYG